MTSYPFPSPFASDVTGLAVPAGASPTLRVTRTRHATVVTLLGEHDVATASELRQALRTPTRAAAVVVDLSECTVLDGSIVGVLVGAASRHARHGRRLTVTAAHGQPRRTLAILRPTFNFAIHLDAETAADGAELIEEQPA